MTQTYVKLKQYVFALILLTATTIIIHSCKKDKKIDRDINSIENAKQWFATTNKKYAPSWDGANVIKEDNVIYTILPSNYVLETGTNKVISYLVIADSLGKYSAKLLEFINSDLPESKRDMASVYQSGKELKSLTGNYNASILVLNSDHTFLYGVQLIDGEVAHQLKIMFKGEGTDGLKNKLLMTLQPPPVVPIEPVCTDWYWSTWDGNTGEPVSEEYLYTTCSGESTGGGGTSETGTNNGRDITDSLTNECLKAALAKAKSVSGPNFIDTVSKIISSLDANTKIKVTVNQINEIFDVNGNNTIDGKTTNYHYGNFDQTFSCSIILNQSILSNATQEYAVATIIHETLHAYLQYKAGNTINHGQNHEEISKNYIAPFVNIMKSLYPALGLKDATAMAWGGVQGTSLWKESYKNDTFKIGDTNQIMSFSTMKGLETAHRNGYADNGTPICPIQ